MAAAAAIAQTGTSGGSQAVALAVFILIETLGVGAPVAIYFLLGERATRLLDELKAWMGSAQRGDHGRCSASVIGAKLVGDAVSGFAGLLATFSVQA